jgi:hypothetical protein
LTNPQEVYDGIKNRALEMKAENPLPKAILDAADSPPADYITQAGWVLIAFQNALWQLLHACTLEEGVVDTVIARRRHGYQCRHCGSPLTFSPRLEEMLTFQIVQRSPLVPRRCSASRGILRHVAASSRRGDPTKG